MQLIQKVGASHNTDHETPRKLTRKELKLLPPEEKRVHVPNDVSIFYNKIVHITNHSTGIATYVCVYIRCNYVQLCYGYLSI